MKFKGLKKASSDTENYGQNSGWYSELFLDKVKHLCYNKDSKGW